MVRFSTKGTHASQFSDMVIQWYLSPVRNEVAFLETLLGLPMHSFYALMEKECLIASTSMQYFAIA